MNSPVDREQEVHQALRIARLRMMRPRPAEYFELNPDWMNDPEDLAEFERLIAQADNLVARLSPNVEPGPEDYALIINARG